jgi:MprA protease rhombosortase-interaction domain-containing protein
VGESLKFISTDASLFGLVSVDLAEYSTAFQSPATVHFVGYRPDGSTVTTDLTTDGIIDGTGPLQDFQTFNFQGFTGLCRVEIPTYGWSLDNLEVSYGIPEPASAALLLIGGLLVYALRRRR